MDRPGKGVGGGTSCSIFVGNVPYDADEDELREIFAKVGSVTSVRVVCDKDTKQPKGYAFCDFQESTSVQAAIEKLNNVEYNGRKLRIDWAERELHASGPALRDRERDDGPGPPPRGGRPPVPASDMNFPPRPVLTVADRLSRMRDQEAEEKAKVAAAENAERAEIGRLMETLTPQQVISIVAEMQRLALRAPEVARALLTENQQLALALHHAQFLAGMIDDPPLSTEPEVRERARSVREKVWGMSTAPAAPHPSLQAIQGPAGVMQQGLLALPQMMAPQVAAMPVPFGATTPASVFGTSAVSPTGGFMQAAAPAAPPPQVIPSAVVPVASVPAPVLAPAAPAPAIPPAVLSQVLGGAATDGASGHGVMDHLLQLTPAEIDRLPHETKVQLLDFIQKMPRPS